MNIYVASSWRNAYQPQAVSRLREAGHDAYDFRAPTPVDSGFSWSAIDPNWQSWDVAAFRRALEHPLATHGFAFDLAAMTMATACVLVLPCGRSAHAEAGWCAGMGKRVYVWSPEPCEPELMYGLFHGISDDLEEIVRWLPCRGGVQ